MWICRKCGARAEDSASRCLACSEPKSKPQRIKNRDLEEVWTAEQQAEWERIVRRRKKIAWVVLSLFIVVAILLYLFVFSESMGWPRPDGLINIGPAAEKTISEAMPFNLQTTSLPR